MPYFVLKMSKIPHSPDYFVVKFSAATKVDVEVTGAGATQ